MRRDAEEVKEIGIEEREHPPLGRLERSAGNVERGERIAVVGLVRPGHDCVAGGKIVAERISVFARIDGGMIARLGDRNRRRAQKRRIIFQNGIDPSRVPRRDRDVAENFRPPRADILD